jgi:hypothetical protein
MASELSQDPNELTFSLNMRMFNELSYFMDTNATIKQCFGVLDRFLFQSVEILRAKKLLNNYLDMYFLPFFRRMLRYIIILGWCPYHIKKVKDRRSGMPILVPEVFPVEFIQCNMIVKKKTMDYEFQFFEDDMESKRRKDIRVFMYSDLTLIANVNLIHSLLSGLIEENRYLMRIKQFTMKSESIRSNPSIYLRRDNDANGVAKLADQANGFNGGGNVRLLPGGAHNNPINADNPANFENEQMTASKVLETSTTDMINNIKFHQHEIQDLGRMRNGARGNGSSSFEPQWHNNLFICPPNTILAATPQLPESRIDQMVIERNLSSQIYMTFGIPETLIGIVGGSQSSIKGSNNRSSNIRKDVNIMDVNNFESTLYRYQNFFQDCFTIIYEEIFKKSVDKDVVSFKPPKLYERFIETILEEHGLKEDGDKSREKTMNKSGEAGKAEVSETKVKDNGATLEKDSVKTTKTVNTKGGGTLKDDNAGQKRKQNETGDIKSKKPKTKK